MSLKEIKARYEVAKDVATTWKWIYAYGTVAIPTDIRQLLRVAEAMDPLLKLFEGYVESIESCRGDCRSFKQVIADGDLEAEVVEARKALNALE